MIECRVDIIRKQCHMAHLAGGFASRLAIYMHVPVRLAEQCILQTVKIVPEQVHHDCLLMLADFRHRVVEQRQDMGIELADAA